MTTDFKNLVNWLNEQKIPSELLPNGELKILTGDLNAMQMTNLQQFTQSATGIKRVNSSEDFLVIAAVELQEQTKLLLAAIYPMEDRILVEEVPAPTVSKGGIIIPDTVVDKPNIGYVRKVGEGIVDVPMKVKEGDKVLFGKWAGIEMEVDDQLYLLMRQTDVLAII